MEIWADEEWEAPICMYKSRVIRIIELEIWADEEWEAQTQRKRRSTKALNAAVSKDVIDSVVVEHKINRAEQKD